MKKKEVLIIFLLAVLVTVLSWFIPFPAVVMPMGWSLRGLPIPYWDDHSGMSLLLLIGDCLFWFLVLAVGWWVVKWIRRQNEKLP